FSGATNWIFLPATSQGLPSPVLAVVLPPPLELLPHPLPSRASARTATATTARVLRVYCVIDCTSSPPCCSTRPRTRPTTSIPPAPASGAEAAVAQLVESERGDHHRAHRHGLERRLDARDDQPAAHDLQEQHPC